MNQKFFRATPLIIYCSLGLIPMTATIADEDEGIVRPVPHAARDTATLSPPAVNPNPQATTSSSTPVTETEGNTSSSATTTSLQIPLPEVVYDDDAKRLAQEVSRSQLEQNKLSLEYNIKLLQVQQEKDKLLLENELQDAKQAQLLSELNALKTRLELENAVQELQQKRLVASLQTEKDKLAMQNALQEEQNKKEILKFQLESTKLEYDMLRANSEKEMLENKLAKRISLEEWEAEVNRPKEYLTEPFVNGRLILSDRKIILDDAIWEGMANYIIERIEYFNNKTSEYPIFFVIDYCPGGSVMEGIRILKAMKKSRAPVYVVVRSLAASMAAAIVTLAERSYALPDAIIVHHQVWGISFGNRVEQKEQLQVMDEWSERLMKPVAEKMGLTLSKLVEQMYEHNSRGDWSEFANEAVKYKWVDHVVEEIRDTSYTKLPVEEEREVAEEEIFFTAANREQVDAQGRRYIKVPHLRPMDVYHLYNPDNYYRY